MIGTTYPRTKLNGIALRWLASTRRPSGVGLEADGEVARCRARYSGVKRACE
jgi:hypothetical protein